MSVESRLQQLERQMQELRRVDKGTEKTTQGYKGAQLTVGTLVILKMDYLNPVQVVSPARWLWIDSTGDLRIHTAAPTADGDGTVVGTQT